jgi:hypothetical protein
MVATDPAFDAALRTTTEAMLAHIAEEEWSLLPRLAAALTPSSQLELGIRFEAAKARGVWGWAGTGGLPAEEGRQVHHGPGPLSQHLK